MQQIRIFKTIESELNALETEINDWLKESGVKILQITGNIAPQTRHEAAMGQFSASDVLVIVTYEDGNG